MSHKAYSQATNIKNSQTPQTQPAPGKEQVQNNAGGFVFATSPWEQLRRFLILGTEGGTYYASQRKLTAENTTNIAKLIKVDAKRVVDETVKVSDEGLAPKNDPALLVLAMVAKYAADGQHRRYAMDNLPKVARIGTHLFHFVEFVNGMRGWGRTLKRGVSNWYLKQDFQNLCYQMVKYRQRDGWSHADVIRLAHPNPGENVALSTLFKWATTKKEFEPTLISGVISAYEVAKTADEKTIIKLISDWNLPREAIPTERLNSPGIWEALLQKMPLEATIRNLNKMSAVGLLTPMSNAQNLVMERLHNEQAIAKQRLHPVKVLIGLNQYSTGHGEKGSLVWTVNQQIVAGLNDTFYLSFKSLVPSNKRTMLALDISGSMTGGNCAGAPFSPRVGSAAMAMVTARVEPYYHLMGFHHQFLPLAINKNMDLESVIKYINSLGFGGTDCSLPMKYALEHKIPVDAFIVYTDNETWGGESHVFEALRNYRQKMGIGSKMVVVGMTSTGFTIADPSDSGMLDVVGFDSSAPEVIANFSAGRI